MRQPAAVPNDDDCSKTDTKREPMSDFTSNFWSVLWPGSPSGIIACALLLWLTSRKKINPLLTTPRAMSGMWI